MNGNSNSINNKVYKNAHHTEPNNTQPLTSQYPDPKGASSPVLENDMRSKPFPCLATAKFNPVLAGTSTLSYITIGYMQQKRNP